MSETGGALYWKERAEKAERERDEAINQRKMDERYQSWLRRLRDKYFNQREIFRRERDEALEEAETWKRAANNYEAECVRRRKIIEDALQNSNTESNYG